MRSGSWAGAGRFTTASCASVSVTNTQAGAGGALRGIPEEGAVDEARVLTGAGGDEDVVVGLAPVDGARTGVRGDKRGQDYFQWTEVVRVVTVRER